jgi:hypothetical protein
VFRIDTSAFSNVLYSTASFENDDFVLATTGSVSCCPVLGLRLDIFTSKTEQYDGESSD